MRQGRTATNHRTNCLLAALEPEDFAALEPHLEAVILPRGTVLYEAGETIRYAYFPHDIIVSLVDVMADGSSAEMTVFGREAVVGLISAFVSRQSVGRYLVQVPGTASRIAIEKLHEAISAPPNLRRLIGHYTETLVAQLLHTIACNAVHSVEARCCRWILSSHDRLPCRLRMSSWPRSLASSAPPSAQSWQRSIERG